MSDPSGQWSLSSILTGVAIVATVVAVAAVVVATAGAAAPAFALTGGAILGGAGGVAAGVATTAAFIAIGTGAAAATAKAAEKVSDKLSRREHTVYKLVDQSTGQTKYVGRTKNPTAREKAHNSEGSKTSGLKFTPIASNLTYFEARGLEQLAMLQCHTHVSEGGLNSIWGISSKNPRGVKYSLAGLDYLNNQVSNEVLCWTEQ
ncbi:MAG: hypothetical protein ABRQ25_18255 [Clostridiaceae bacterium]